MSLMGGGLAAAKAGGWGAERVRWRKLQKGGRGVWGRPAAAHFWRIWGRFTEMVVGAARYRSGMAGAGLERGWRRAAAGWTAGGGGAFKKQQLRYDLL